MRSDAAPAADIAVIGGGFAGALAALTLAREGHAVTMIDLHSAFPPLFRADKIAGDQLPLLRELGLLDAIAEASTLASKVVNIHGAAIVDWRRIEDYSLSYQTMVNTLRQRLGPNVRRLEGRVVDIETGEDMQRVILANGEVVEARLVVLATGGADALRRKLGVERRIVQENQSVSIGFSIAPPPAGFRFPALTAYGERIGDGVDYVSFLPLGDVMRANLFLFTDMRDPRIVALRERPWQALFEILPGLRPWIGDCELIGEIELGAVDLFICENAVRDGVVMIGDAFRTSCPAVGSGLSCILVDVTRLKEHVAQWMATPGMGAEKIAAFYSDPIKVARDVKTHGDALDRRRAATQTTLTRQLQRAARYKARSLRDRLLALTGVEPAHQGAPS